MRLLHGSCNFYGPSTWNRRWKTCSSLVQRPTDALWYIFILCPVRIFGHLGFPVDPTQGKDWKILQGYWPRFYVVSTSPCPLRHSSLVFDLSLSFDLFCFRGRPLMFFFFFFFFFQIFFIPNLKKKIQTQTTSF